VNPPTPIALLALLFAAILPAPAQSPQPANFAPIHPTSAHQAPSTLRIGLWTLWHDKQLTLAPVSGPAATLGLCPNCASIALTRPTLIRTSNSQLLLPNHSPIAAITVSGPINLSAHNESLTLRHPLSISVRDGQLVLAVTLPLESYVERVVSSESGPNDSLESLKALAIVVRTFALHQPHAHADYDLCDSTHCQLLRWSGGPSPSAHAATLATAGETLWYHGHPAAAWFHQDCGGRTAAPSELWPSPSQGREAHSPAHNTPGTPDTRYPIPDTLSRPTPWLASRADPYCTANGVRSWSADISLADLTTALSAAGLVRPGWRTLTVARRGDPALGQSPRAVTLLAGSTAISAEDFRLAVGRAFGWGHILSTWFEIVSESDHFLFNGRGSGHGVGLCQHGSAVMASQGRPAAEILAQYFPGAEALDESTARPWQSLPIPGAAHTVILETLDSSASSYLPTLAQALAQAQSRSGLQFPSLQASAPLTVRAYPTTNAFRDSTLAPGWVAAFTEGNLIATQPLATLSSRRLLLPTLRHEFLHALLEAHSSPNAPLWLREGLVEVFSDPPPSSASPSAPKPAIPLTQLDQLLAHPASESQSASAHRAAAYYAARLLAHYGRAQVLAWLATSLPANAGLR
jgi:stage II sporulation protein D